MISYGFWQVCIDTQADLKFFVSNDRNGKPLQMTLELKVILSVVSLTEIDYI